MQMAPEDQYKPDTWHGLAVHFRTRDHFLDNYVFVDVWLRKQTGGEWILYTQEEYCLDDEPTTLSSIANEHLEALGYRYGG